MADYHYAYNGPTEKTARAVLRDAPISTKVAIEISNYLRGRSTEKAKKILEAVLKKEHAIPFKRFTDGVGHRKGPLGAGRYPEKASKAFLQLIQMVEANAANHGLGDELIIKHLVAQKASTPWHFGRHRRRKTKRTHVEIVVEEIEETEKKEKKTKKQNKTEQKETKETKQAKEQETTTKTTTKAKKETKEKKEATPKTSKTTNKETKEAKEAKETKETKSSEDGDNQ